MAKAIQKDPSVLTAMGSSSSVRGAGEETIRRLYEQGTLRRYDKNESVLHAKKHTDHVCFLISGKVIEYNMTLQGKRKILFVLGEGALLNDCIVTNTPAIYCDTIDTSSILQVPNDRFVEIMKEDYPFCQAVMKEQEKKYQRLIHQLKNSVGNINMDRKIAAKLWKLGRDFGIPRGEETEIDIDLSVTLLADMLGTSRENTSRLLTNMTEQGLIRHEKKRIIIHDMASLSHFYQTGL